MSPTPTIANDIMQHDCDNMLDKLIWAETRGYMPSIKIVNSFIKNNDVPIDLLNWFELHGLICDDFDSDPSIDPDPANTQSGSDD